MVRQIRKAGRDDDSDEEKKEPQVSKSKPAPKSAKPKPVFSGFDDDEDAASASSLSLSSSSLANKETSKFKKIRQAPDAGRALMQVDPEPQQSSSSGASSYTHDSLQELRQSQKFATVAASREMAEMEGMELVGDEAESLEERLANAQDGNEGEMLLSARDRPAQEDPDLAEEDGMRRVSFSRTEQRREFVPVEARESEWEGEMMRRGGNISAGGSSSSSGSSSSGGSGSRPMRSLGGGQQGPSMSDISRSLEQAKQSLAQSTAAASRRLAQLQAQHDQAQSDSFAGSNGLPARVEQLNALRLFRVYISEVVGMLRDKQGMGEQLQAAVLGMVREQRGALRAARLEQQEDACYQAGPDLGLGAYSPTGILREVAALRGGGAGGVDQFGRQRASLDSPFAREELARQLAARASDRVSALLDLPPVLEGTETEGYARDCQPSAAVCARLFSQADTLHRAAQCVLEDVRPEIRSLDHLLSRLADFRAANAEKYAAAYTSLSLPPVLLPFALLDLLEELPLPQPGGGAVTPLRERGWFRAIQLYGQGGAGAAAVGESGSAGGSSSSSSSSTDDASLLAKVLALGVLPLLARLCEGLDPLSAAHVAQAVDWLDCLERPETAGGPALATQPLWSAVFAQFEAALLGPSGELALVPVLPARVGAGAEGAQAGEGEGAAAFACQQLRRVTVALAHLCLFKRLQLRAAGAGAGTGDGHAHIARIALQTCLRCLPACCALLSATDGNANGDAAQALAAVWPLLRVTTKLVPVSLLGGLCRAEQVPRFERLRTVVGVGRGLEDGREAELRAAMEALR